MSGTRGRAAAPHAKAASIFLRITTVNDTQHTQHEEGVGAFRLINNLTDTTHHHTNKHRRRASANRSSIQFASSFYHLPFVLLLAAANSHSFLGVFEHTNHIFYLYCACHRLAQPTRRRGKKTRQERKQYVWARPYVVQRKSVVNDCFRRWERVKPREMDGRMRWDRRRGR